MLFRKVLTAVLVSLVAAAAQAQERLRQIMGTLSRTPVGSPDVVPPLALTLSIGVTDWTSEDEMADLVGRADQAMYDAKRAGKNRIEIRRRPAKSRLFQNGRPVAGMVEAAGLHSSSRATGTNG